MNRGELTPAEISRILRDKHGKKVYKVCPKLKRKYKLKMRFKDRLGEEIASTKEKLELLYEIRDEQSNG